MSTPKGKLWLLRECCPRKAYDESVDSVTTYFSSDKKQIIKDNINNIILNIQINNKIEKYSISTWEMILFCKSKKHKQI